MDTVSKSDWVTDRTYMAGRVARYACWPTLHKQTVGEHCWQIANIYEEIFGALSTDVERYIRHHDSAELIVGDPPFPIKRDNPALKTAYDALEPAALKRLGVTLPELPPEERTRVKVCDLLEMTQFGMIERELGNLLAVPIVLRTMRTALDLSAKSLSEEDVHDVWVWLKVKTQRHLAVLRGADVSHDYHERVLG